MSVVMGLETAIISTGILGAPVHQTDTAKKQTQAADGATQAQSGGSKCATIYSRGVIWGNQNRAFE